MQFGLPERPKTMMDMKNKAGRVKMAAPGHHQKNKLKKEDQLGRMWLYFISTEALLRLY